MQCPICIFHTFRWSLRLVHKLLLAMIDDIAVLLRLLLLRIDHRVLVAHLVQILLLVRLLIRVISSPYHTGLVVRPLRTQTKLKRRHEIISKIRVLHQLQTIVVVVCAHPDNNLLTILVKHNRIVVLSHCICCILIERRVISSIFLAILASTSLTSFPQLATLTSSALIRKVFFCISV